MLDKNQKIFIQDIKTQIKAAQYRALQNVNKEQIQLYWNIGKTIFERQQEFGWGKGIVEVLALDLQQEFIGINGFSARNLWRMKSLYEQYANSIVILPPMVAEIPWTHNILILEKCKDEHERLFYIHCTKQYQWSKSLLINAIKNQQYQNTVVNQTNFEQTLPANQAQEATMFLKDELTFDFLNLKEPHLEAELEQAILSNIRNFLIELGGDFTFIGNQFPIKLNKETYEIDLLLYHRELQSLVAIDLKIDNFTPEMAGKMNFYLSALNTIVKKPHENASIGIIICQSKNRTTVDFALQDINKPIGVATYKLQKSLPKNMKSFFPSNKEFVEKVQGITKYITAKKKNNN
jgi:predicted nuclease of restriction endonuclease-like (RecB) superfamily